MRIVHVCTSILFCALPSAYADTVRRVELVDFVEKPGSFTNGGEFPGATVDGSFVVTSSGRTTVRLAYDLTKGSYVGYSLMTKIPAGTDGLEVTLANGTDRNLAIGVRFTDASNQTYMARTSGPVPVGAKRHVLTASFASHDKGWRPGGTTDGKVHYPIGNIVVMNCRGEIAPKGWFAIGSIKAVTTASEQSMPSHFLTIAPARFGAYWYPGEASSFDVALVSREDRAAAGEIHWKLTDWLGESFGSGTVSGTHLLLPEKVFRNRVGSFCIKFMVKSGAVDLVREMWLARLTSANPKPCRWVGSLSPSWGYPLCNACGIGRLNCSTEWFNAERQKGAYDFTTAEKRADEMLAHGIMPAPMIQSPNSLYDDPIDTQAFARFAAAFATRMNAKGIDRVEIWNEPQNFWFRQHYGGDYGDNGWVPKYVTFTRTVRDAINEAAPDMTVSVAAEDIEWLLYDMLVKGIAREGDQISFHPYCHYGIRPENVYFFRDGGEVIRKLALFHGGAKRFGISETGWTTYTGKGEYWDVAGCFPRATYEQQAKYIVRAYLLGALCGADWVLQYRFDDSGPREEYTEHNFGMIRRDRTPKPSFAAVAFMTRTVGSFKEAKELSRDLAAYRIGKFTMPDGKIIYAAWAVSADFKWTIPGERPYRLFDMMGNRLPLQDSRNLVLTERPIYVVID